MSVERPLSAARERPVLSERGGTQQGDYSRGAAEPGRRYSAVRMQQGRVLLDADWNAQIDLMAWRQATETRDLVGPSGAPQGDAGFGLEVEAVLSFEGRDQHLSFEVDTWEELSGEDGFSFEMRILPRSSGVACALLSLAGRHQGGRVEAAGFALELDVEARLRLHRPGRPPLLCAERLEIGRFVAVGLSGSRGGVTLWINGREAASDAVPILPPSGPARLIFGAAVAQPSKEPRETTLPGFDGELHELCLWRGPRRQAGLLADPSRLVDVASADLAAAWAFWAPVPQQRVADRLGLGPELRLGSDTASAPTWRLRQLHVGRGRYYVEGLLCENDLTRPISRQLDLPGASLPVLSHDRVYLFYLDAWELLVTDLQDPSLAEVALGGADTTVRSRTVSQVRLLPLPAEDVAAPGALARAWSNFVERSRSSGRLSARRVPSPVLLGNLLYRVELHSSGGLYGWPRQLGATETVISAAPLAAKDAAAGAGLRLRLADWPEGEEQWQVGDRVELWSDTTDAAGQPGPTAAVAALDASSRTLELEQLSGPQPNGKGLRLRRVATWKWSRQNASVVYALAEIEPGSRVVTLTDPGRRAIELEVGDWVEYLDDETLLRQEPQSLARVEAFDPALLTLTLSRAPLANTRTAGPHPALRRWDQRRAETGPSGSMVATPGWVALEDGVEVCFAGDGRYRAGDFWWLPARTATQTIEWPEVLTQDGERLPEARGPRGVAHALAPLAALGFELGSYVLRDLRKTFRPLTDGAVSKAGDTMYGPLVIRSHLAVEGGGPSDPGTVSAELFYGPLGSPSSVTTPNIAPQAVTGDKLAPDIGVVPPGYAILGPTPESPPGYTSTGSALTVFQPAARWRERVSFPRASPGPLRGAFLDGRLFVMLESGELWQYEPRANRWQSRCRRPGELQSFAVAAAAGRLFVVGGVDPHHGKSSTTWIYEPGLDRWSPGSPMPTPRSHLSLAAVGERLFAVGGLERGLFGERASRANEEYDPQANRWSRRAPLPRRAYELGLGGAAGSLHAFGGFGRPWFGYWGRSMTNSHHQYQPASNHWQRHGAPLPFPMAHPGVAEVEDHLFVLGGEGALGPLDLTLELDPAVAYWQRRPALGWAAAWVATGAEAGRLFACLDATSTANPPTAELPAAMRYYIHRKEDTAEPAGSLTTPVLQP